MFFWGHWSWRASFGVIKHLERMFAISMMNLQHVIFRFTAIFGYVNVAGGPYDCMPKSRTCPCPQIPLLIVHKSFKRSHMILDLASLPVVTHYQPINWSIKNVSPQGAVSFHPELDGESGILNWWWSWSIVPWRWVRIIKSHVVY